MRARIRQHLPVVITAGVVAAVTAAGPALATAAYDAVNSDKVDGKHAVGAKASPADRAGKLVATDRRGRLPNNIIGQAPDSGLLDGLDSSAFLPADGTASDAQLLDGLDSSAFLAADGTAGNAHLLDGLDSSAFLPADGKANDANQLDGLDSSAFLRSNGKANDADRLDGLDSSAFVRGKGQILHGARAVQPNSNFTAFVLQAPDPGFTIGYVCPSSPTTQNGFITFYNTTNEVMNVFADNGGDNPLFSAVTPFSANGTRWDLGSALAGEHITYQAQVAGRVMTIDVHSVHRSNDCHVQVTAYVSRD